MTRGIRPRTSLPSPGALRLLAVLLTVPAAGALAADVTLETSLQVRTMYDDNILFTNTAETDDVVTAISPRLGFSRKTARSTMNLAGIFDVIRYAATPELDTLHHRYALNGRGQVTPRWAVTGEGEYRKDTALDEVEETGRLGVRTDRELLLGGAGVSYQFTERSELGLSYRHMGYRFEDEAHQDRDSDTVTGIYSRVLGETRGRAWIQPRYTHWETSDNRTDDYETAVGWTMPFRERYSFEGSVGGRYTVAEREFLVRQVSDPTADTGFQVIFVPDSRREVSWGFTVSVLTRWTGELSQASLGYTRDSWVDSLGATIESDNLRGDVRRRLTPRLSVGIAGRLSFARSIGGPEQDRSQYFDLAPSLTYLVTESISIEAAHRYARDWDETKSPDPVSVRNQTWVLLKVDFTNWHW